MTELDLSGTGASDRRVQKGALVAALGVAFVLGAGAGAIAALSLRRPPIPQLEETRFLNFDPESTSLEALSSGWSGFERNQQNDSFVWCAALECRLAIQLHGSRERVVRTRAWAFTYPGAPKQTVLININDVLVGSHDLASAESWELRVPVGVWRDGQNVIRFDFTYAESPATRIAQPADARTLAAAFDWLEIVPL
jgi:hypothetical protein